jgi:hypothetical protein
MGGRDRPTTDTTAAGVSGKQRPGITRDQYGEPTALCAIIQRLKTRKYKNKTTEGVLLYD